MSAEESTTERVADLFLEREVCTAEIHSESEADRRKPNADEWRCRSVIVTQEPGRGPGSGGCGRRLPEGSRDPRQDQFISTRHLHLCAAGELRILPRVSRALVGCNEINLARSRRRRQQDGRLLPPWYSTDRGKGRGSCLVEGHPGRRSPFAHSRERPDLDSRRRCVGHVRGGVWWGGWASSARNLDARHQHLRQRRGWVEDDAPPCWPDTRASGIPRRGLTVVYRQRACTCLLSQAILQNVFWPVFAVASRMQQHPVAGEVDQGLPLRQVLMHTPPTSRPNHATNSISILMR